MKEKSGSAGILMVIGAETDVQENDGRLTMAKVEFTWDCPQCGTKGVKGRYYDCPNCGHPRGEIKFNTDNAARVNDPEILSRVTKEPDWLCNFCGALSPSSSENCISCGAPKLGTKDYFEMREDVEKREREEESFEAHDTSYPSYVQQGMNYAKLKDTFKGINVGALLGVLGTIFFSVLFIVGLSWLLTPKIETLTIEDFRWERSIEIQEDTVVQESGWNLPSGARLLYTQEEFHHTEQQLTGYETVSVVKTREVLDHYEQVVVEGTRQVIEGYESYVSGIIDYGNGFGEEIISERPIYGTETYTYYEQQPVYETETYTEYESEPIYIDIDVNQTKYYYEINKWVHSRDVYTEGTGHEPVWGQVILDSDEREGTRSERYYIQAMNEEGESVEYRADYADWVGFEIGQEIEVTIDLFGRIQLVD